mmetsp:Transcript_24988/g.48783  ORF Transcript_24988/g.48783 Transcript_24988/m.48783 type:complete len:365 (+) Transcript_24988:69-1163(+)
MASAGANGVRSCTVFIGNIPYDASEEDLKGIFGRVGSVESLRLVYDRDTKQPKGYGFCDYADPDTAMSAVRNLNDAEFSGRKLRIDLADNALRGREIPSSKISAPSLPSALPITDVQARPALPPVGPVPSATATVSLPHPTSCPIRPPVPTTGAISSGAPACDMETDVFGNVTSATTPEAVISAATAYTEIAETIAAMPQSQLQLCLGTMKELAVACPEEARVLLQDNPQLCYALLHAQFMLGMNLEPSAPANEAEMQRLRAEAARRPTIIPLVPAGNVGTPGTGVVVPPNVPGILGSRPLFPSVTPARAGMPGMSASVLQAAGLQSPLATRQFPSIAVPPVRPAVVPGLIAKPSATPRPTSLG